MRGRLRITVVAAEIACSCLGLGCRKLRSRSEPPPPPKPVATAAVKASASGPSAAKRAPVTLAPPPDPRAPGPAYILQGDKTLSVIDADGTVGEVKDLPRAEMLTVAPDGRVFAATPSEVFQLTGREARSVLAVVGVQLLTLSPTGSFFGSRFSDLFEGAPGSSTNDVTVTNKDALGVDLVKGVAVDAKGTIWVGGAVRRGSSYEAIVVKGDGKTLTPVELPAPPQYSINAIVDVAATARGIVVMRDKDVVLFRDGAPAEVIMTARSLEFRHLSVAQDGAIALQEHFGSISVVAANAKKGRTLEMAKDRHYDNVAIDGLGRLWLFQGNALVVYDGKRETPYPQGSLPRWDTEVKAAVVVGAGPAAITKGTPRTGTVKGVFVHGGAPLAKADVELCQDPAQFISSRPCESALSRVNVKTDASGAFEATVPAGPLNLAVRDKKGWIISRVWGGRAIKESATIDLGTMDLDRAK